MGYICKKDLYKAHECPWLVASDKKEVYKHKLEDRKTMCFKGDFRGEQVFNYVCKDCGKVFIDPLMELVRPLLMLII